MAHGRYTIVGKLADGGMAEIFLAMQHGAEGFAKAVVLKRVLSAFSADPQFRNMFLDEAQISMGLSHGNIVQVLDVGVSGERTFLVLELVEGWDLEQIMDRAQATGPDHPWPPSLALYVTAQLCRALAYAHAKRGKDGRSLGIVHRDVSPNNVLISEQGEVKLADFGIAKAESKREQTLAGVIKGKIGFMSPEQALGRPLDARADLFSVGTVMYLMLTGRRPFEAGSELESMMKAQRAEYLPPEQLNPYLSHEATAIVNRAMRLDATARYQTADQMLIDIERVLRSQYKSAGQTELKTWLAELSQRDGAVPIGHGRLTDGDTARPVFVDEGGDLSAGTSVELSDIDGSSSATAASARTVVPVVGPAAATTAGPTVAPSIGPTAAQMQVVFDKFNKRTPSGPAGASLTTPVSGPAVALPVTRVQAVTSDGMPIEPASSPTSVSARMPLVTMTDVGVNASALRRLPRKGRVGLGFVLGALCMLGAVFGIKWLAQWAGHERIGLSKWYVPPGSSDVPPSGAVHAPAGQILGAGEANGAGAPSPETPAAASAGVDGGKVAALGAGDRDAAGIADAQAPTPNATIATDEDDEVHLLKRIVPDAAAVIGEDEAEQRPREKNGRVGGQSKTAVTDDVPLDADSTRAGASGKTAGRSGSTAHLADADKTRSSTAAGRAAPARSQPVQVRITTSPLGAVVRTKKQVLGRTPLAIRFNPGSTYELTFVKSGYVTNSRRLAVAVGKPQSISVAMKKAPPPARRTGLFRGR
jgi:serine/threonine protein kinase